MRTSLLIFLFVIIATGCGNKNSIPSGVMQPKKMEAVLWDMMRADQFLSDFVLNKDTSLNKTAEHLKLYQQIFAIHKINKEEFQHSFTYYKDHPVLLKAIMDSISTPENNSPVKTVQPGQVTTPVIAVPDTATRLQNKNVPDTSARKKKKQVLVD